MLAGLGVILVIPAALAAAVGVIGIILSSKNRQGRNKAKSSLIESFEKTLDDLKSKIKTLGDINNDFALGVLLSLKALNNDQGLYVLFDELEELLRRRTTKKE